MHDISSFFSVMPVDKFIKRNLPAFVVVAGETVVVSAEIKNKNNLNLRKTLSNLHKRSIFFSLMALDKFSATKIKNNNNAM